MSTSPPTLRYNGHRYVYVEGEWFQVTYPGAGGTIILDGTEPEYELVTDDATMARLDALGQRDPAFLAALNAVR